MTIRRVNVITKEVEVVEKDAPSFPEKPTAELIRAEGAVRLAGLVSEYAREERETWPTQVAEARAYLDDDAADVPFISALAQARGMSLSDFAGLILEKESAYKSAVSAVLAAQARLLAETPYRDDFRDDRHWTA